MTRRDMLALPLAAAPLAAARRVDRSRISAISDECANNPAEAIAFARQYGLKWLELRGVPGGKQAYEAMPEPELRAAAKEFADAGLGISFLDASLLKYGLPGTEPVRRRPESEEARARRIQQEGARFERRMEDLARAIRAARILGTDKIRIFTFSRVEEPARLMPRLVEILDPMVALAAKEKVYLLVENEGSCNVATSAESAALMKMVPSKWLGINWDPLNAGGFQEIPFPDGYRLLPVERVGNVHIKGRSILDYPQRMDWKAVFEAFTRDGYRGCFGLETHIFGPQLIEMSHASMKEILRLVG
ncbi:MAG: sugar phosphate isomerase/epimerase [Acidobacteria bacterium]|nr:sugar phosphate isomerase/epimerase [Acidobacteriota bacterium]